MTLLDFKKGGEIIMVNRKKGYHQLRQKDFDEIRLLLDKGIATKIIMAATGRSDGLIYTLKNFKTFAEYKASNRAKSKKEVVPAKVTASETGKSDDKTIVALLERIAEALELMEAHWRPLPSDQKKRFKLF